MIKITRISSKSPVRDYEHGGDIGDDVSFAC